MDFQEAFKNIGKKIVVIRQAKGITQVDLAFSVGMEDSALRRIEKGRTNPTVKTLLRIAEGLDVDIRYLFDFECNNKNTYTIRETSSLAAEDKVSYKKETASKRG